MPKVENAFALARVPFDEEDGPLVPKAQILIDLSAESYEPHDKPVRVLQDFVDSALVNPNRDLRDGPDLV